MESTSPPPRRIVFTGGSGEAGRLVISHLLSLGYQILNLDRVPLANPSVQTLITDLTSYASVSSALRSAFCDADFFLPSLPVPDAVIHFAGHPRPLTVPSHDLFANNVGSTFNVLTAAAEMGIRKVVVASSASVYGVWSQGGPQYAEFPIEEGYDCNPSDFYALSKLVGERIARTVAERYGVDVYCLRFGAVIAPEKYATSPQIHDKRERKRIGWSYTDVRDLGAVCDLAVGKDGLGWQVFNVVNDGVTEDESTTTLIRREYPDAKITREMGERESPISNRKVKELLGWSEGWNWINELRKSLEDEQ